MTSDVVEVHLFAAARAAVGAATITVRPGRMSVVLADLEQAHPDFARVRPQCSYLLDGVAVHDDPAEVDLDAGMRLDVLPPFAGG